MLLMGTIGRIRRTGSFSRFGCAVDSIDVDLASIIRLTSEERTPARQVGVLTH
jgi:hypothetical protein